MPEYTDPIRKVETFTHPTLDKTEQLVAFPIGPINLAVIPFMPNRNTFNAVQGVKKRVIHQFYKLDNICPLDKNGRYKMHCSWAEKDDFLEKMPESDEYKKLHHFVQDKILPRLKVFDHIDISSENLERWLAEFDRPEARKDQIRKAFQIAEEKGFQVSPRDRRCKTFLKVEMYEEKKYARCICPREDMVVAMLGYAIHQLEHYVFHESEFAHHFVKGLTPQEQVHKMNNIFNRDDVPKVEWDYSSFEGSYTVMYQHIVEVSIMRHVFRNSPEILNVLESLYTDTRLKSKLFNIVTIGSRMSGDLWTSLFNGMSNLINTLYLFEKHNIVGDGLVEGDDGLWWVSSPAITPKDFSDLGFKIKIEYKTNVNECSFCQKIFNTETLNLLAPPELINRVGWCPQMVYLKQKKSVQDNLLAAKAFSYLTLYPHCPVISVMMVKILNRLHIKREQLVEIMHHSQGLDWYHKWLIQCTEDEYDDAGSIKLPHIDIRDRILYEQRFNVPIEQQITMEETFDGASDFYFPFDMASYSEGVHDTMI